MPEKAQTDPIEGPPVLETPRLRLRPRAEHDFDACFAMDREPGTLDWIPWPEETGSWADQEAHRAFLCARIEERYPPGMGYWTITWSELPDSFLGWILLIPTEGGEVEIGWRLPHAARGSGIASEAARAVLDHARRQGLSPIIADIHPGNAASIRVAKKIGMVSTRPAPDEPHLVRFQIGV